MKSGYKTTEFWLTLIAQVVPILVLTGLVGPEESQVVQDQLSHLIEMGFAFGASLISLVVYVWSRTRVKAIEPK